MSDLSKHFLSFSKSISLTKTERLYLRKARSTVTRKIKQHFVEHGLPAVEFKVQGAYTMNTIIKSLQDPFDIDIGLYLRNQGNDTDTWPRPERVSQWVVNALRDHTSFTPINKKKCVRLQYRSGSEIAYHVDIPIYIGQNTWSGKETRIGSMGENQWDQLSDPQGFTKWFFKKCEENHKDKNQLIRLVQYIKAWKDYNSLHTPIPSGMALTAIMAKMFVPDKRDDLSFKATIRACYNSLEWLFWVNYIESPVQPYNNLTKKFTSNQMRSFLNRLGNLVDDMKTAITSTDPVIALNLVKQNFDSRFK